MKILQLQYFNIYNKFQIKHLKYLSETSSQIWGDPWIRECSKQKISWGKITWGKLAFQARVAKGKPRVQNCVSRGSCRLRKTEKIFTINNEQGIIKRGFQKKIEIF